MEFLLLPFTAVQFIFSLLGEILFGVLRLFWGFSLLALGIPVLLGLLVGGLIFLGGPLLIGILMVVAFGFVVFSKRRRRWGRIKLGGIRWGRLF